MKLLGFNFTKINAEKSLEQKTGIKINTNINIPEIKEVKSEMFKKEALISISFSYEIDYSPEFAKITLEGNLILSVDAKKAKSILKDWESKKISEEIKTTTFNIVFKKANLRALQLEEELNIPFHMPMPSLKLDDKKEK